jgi:hypothetical protein
LLVVLLNIKKVKSIINVYLALFPYRGKLHKGLNITDIPQN